MEHINECRDCGKYHSGIADNSPRYGDTQYPSVTTDVHGFHNLGEHTVRLDRIVAYVERLSAEDDDGYATWEIEIWFEGGSSIAIGDLTRCDRREFNRALNDAMLGLRIGRKLLFAQSSVKENDNVENL